MYYNILFIILFFISTTVNARCICDPADNSCLNNCVNSAIDCISKCNGNENNENIICQNTCVIELWPEERSNDDIQQQNQVSNEEIENQENPTSTNNNLKMLLAVPIHDGHRRHNEEQQYTTVAVAHAPPTLPQGGGVIGQVLPYILSALGNNQPVNRGGQPGLPPTPPQPTPYYYSGAQPGVGSGLTGGSQPGAGSNGLTGGSQPGAGSNGLTGGHQPGAGSRGLTGEPYNNDMNEGGQSNVQPGVGSLPGQPYMNKPPGQPDMGGQQQPGLFTGQPGMGGNNVPLMAGQPMTTINVPQPPPPVIRPTINQNPPQPPPPPPPASVVETPLMTTHTTLVSLTTASSTPDPTTPSFVPSNIFHISSHSERNLVDPLAIMTTTVFLFLATFILV